MQAFAITLGPDPTLLRGLRHALASWLDGAGASGPDRDSMVLATHEAAAHAMQSGESGTVDVSVDHDDGRRFVVQVRSDKVWRTVGSDGRGGGLSVMTQLMTEVSTRTSTTVRMSKDT